MDIPVLLVDSDSENENNFRPDLNTTYGSSQFFNYSIPVSDSESEIEQSNEVNGISKTPSKQIVNDQGGHDKYSSNNNNVATVEHRKARQDLTEEGSCNGQLKEKTSKKHKQTEVSIKNSSETGTEINLSKSFKKSIPKTGKEKLNKSSNLVDVEDPSCSENMIKEISKKIKIDKTTNCNGNKLELETTVGQSNKINLLSEESTNNVNSKNNKKKSKHGSNDIKSILIQNLLSKTEKSFTKQNVIRDGEKKKSKIEKRKNETVGINESKAVSLLETSKSGVTPANERDPCEPSLPVMDQTLEASLPIVDETLEGENSFQVKHMF